MSYGEAALFGGSPSVGDCDPVGHRVRDGTLTGCEFQVLVQEIRNSLQSSLQSGADYEIGAKEKTPLAKTLRTCRQLLKVESLRVYPPFFKSGGKPPPRIEVQLMLWGLKQKKNTRKKK